MTYEELVEKVASNWDKSHEGLHGPEMAWNPEYPDLEWDWNNIHELNLWNYWQGSRTHKADIMLVGQDWGNPYTLGGDILYGNIVNGRNYFTGLNKKFDTDINLGVLFAVLKKDGKQLYPDIIQNRYDNLYFTNFCLGYRKNNSSGGMTKTYMMRDKCYFSKLSEIVDPKIIITLGKTTYECAVSALQKAPFTAKNFLQNLRSGELNKIRTNVNGHEVAVVGVAHCGAYGVNINRVKYEPAGANGLDLMKTDWERINPIIDELM